MTSHRFAIVFPGQGSQSVGMLADAAVKFPEISEAFSSASEVLGYDLQKLAFDGPAEKLNQTRYTQPALLAASYAVWQIIYNRTSKRPSMLAGHSLGEYTALVCAGALNYTDAVKLVAARGQFMQEAVAEGAGAMAAIIGLDEDTVINLCDTVRESNEVLSAANFNSVGQVVIAGHASAVQRAMSAAKEKGAKMAVQIPVSVPSHCELMMPAAERLGELLQKVEIYPTQIPVLNNVDAAEYTTAASIRDGLKRQLFMPVRWVEIIQQMMASQINHIIECGPGKVLTGLNKRIDKTLHLQSICDLASMESFINEMNERNQA